MAAYKDKVATACKQSMQLFIQGNILPCPPIWMQLRKHLHRFAKRSQGFQHSNEDLVEERSRSHAARCVCNCKDLLLDSYKQLFCNLYACFIILAGGNQPDKILSCILEDFLKGRLQRAVPEDQKGRDRNIKYRIFTLTMTQLECHSQSKSGCQWQFVQSMKKRKYHCKASNKHANNIGKNHWRILLARGQTVCSLCIPLQYLDPVVNHWLKIGSLSGHEASSENDAFPASTPCWHFWLYSVSLKYKRGTHLYITSSTIGGNQAGGLLLQNAKYSRLHAFKLSWGPKSPIRWTSRWHELWHIEYRMRTSQHEIIFTGIWTVCYKETGFCPVLVEKDDDVLSWSSEYHCNPELVCAMRVVIANWPICELFIAGFGLGMNDALCVALLLSSVLQSSSSSKTQHYFGEGLDSKL